MRMPRIPQYARIGIVGGVLIALHALGVLAPVASVIVSSLGRAASSVSDSTRSVAGFLSSLGGATDQERIRMSSELDRLRQENAELKGALSENETLRAQLEFKKRSTGRSILAHVIGVSPNGALNSIVIDKGRRDGVGENRAVITDSGQLVGKTAAVSDSSAHVLLLSDKESRLIASILARSNATGIIRGEFQLGLVMDLIPITEKISVNDIVVTAGLEEGIPQGLLIGTVSEIRTRPNDFYQTASIQPFADSSKVRIVSVIIPE